RIGSLFPQGKAGLYIFGLSQPRGGAGPVISAGAPFLAETVRVQEALDHPIAKAFERLRPARWRMLVGGGPSLPEIKAGRRFLKYLAWKSGAKVRPGGGPRPTPRNPKFQFGTEVPKNWLGGNAFATHLANSLNLVFPAGERSFVRSVRKYS